MRMPLEELQQGCLREGFNEGKKKILQQGTMWVAR
jgi:hypothetical protein